MKRFFRVISATLLFSLLLTGCQGIDPVTTETEPSPETTATTTEPTVTVPTGTSQTTTTEETDPALEVRNVLMIGNSFCYYHVEELYGIAKADGYQLTVANLYKSGCRLYEHWSWYQNKTPSKYQLFITDLNGRRKVSDTITINDTLSYKDWDVISLQQHFDPADADTFEEAYATCGDAKKLLDTFKTTNPDARLLWLQTWAYQVGYKGAATDANKKNNFVNVPYEKKVLTIEKQTANAVAINQTGRKIAEENGIDLLPMGEAWAIARADARIGDTLCGRLDNNYNDEPANTGDYYHDGDIGGGQYLNACVWYEVIMQKSCIGNTYRPSYKNKSGTTYTLTEDQITALQEAAHKAVANVYGENYAK